jgi:hypothetical protein
VHRLQKIFHNRLSFEIFLYTGKRERGCLETKSGGGWSGKGCGLLSPSIQGEASVAGTDRLRNFSA